MQKGPRWRGDRRLKGTYLGARHAYAIAIGGHSLFAETEDVLEPGPVYASFEPKHTLLVSA